MNRKRIKRIKDRRLTSLIVKTRNLKKRLNSLTMKQLKKMPNQQKCQIIDLFIAALNLSSIWLFDNTYETKKQIIARQHLIDKLKQSLLRLKNKYEGGHQGKKI